MTDIDAPPRRPDWLVLCLVCTLLMLCMIAGWGILRYIDAFNRHTTAPALLEGYCVREGAFDCEAWAQAFAREHPDTVEICWQGYKVGRLDMFWECLDRHNARERLP